MTQPAITVRPFRETDWPALWPILEATCRPGDTYAFARDIGEAQMHAAWIELPAAVFVAEDPHGVLLGSYYLKPNQPGQGAHVCNAGYVVSTAARGRGTASLMCEHSQSEAVARGFLAMQFNFVVATNEVAVRLWQKHGFEIVGTLPKAFRHPSLGFVDALVMFKPLQAPTD